MPRKRYRHYNAPDYVTGKVLSGYHLEIDPALSMTLGVTVRMSGDTVEPLYADGKTVAAALKNLNTKLKERE